MHLQSPMTTTSSDHLPQQDVLLDALRRVMDPEIGMNIVDLGLIYLLDIDAENHKVTIEMTMTSPACPMSEMILDDVDVVLSEQLPESAAREVRLVWEPPWHPSMMCEEARKHFGW